MVFTEGNVNAKQCIDKLRDNLYKNALKIEIPNLNYFQQDNDPQQIAYKIMVAIQCKKSNANSTTINRPQSDWKFMAYFGYENKEKENF